MLYLRNHLKSLSFLFTIVSIISCEKAEPTIENEEELITTLIYKLTPNTGEAIELIFRDLDGDGGTPPVIIAPELTSNTIYTGSITLLNEQVVPAFNITDEVLEEAKDHQFFFTSSNGNVTIQYQDNDDNGKPIGIKTKFNTGSSSSDKLTITLKHQPDKSAAGAEEGRIANAGGETDIQVEFDLQIK